MRYCLIGKKKKYAQLGFTEEDTTMKVEELIDGIKQKTNLSLNADESVKSLSMEPEQRAFYEGTHLTEPTKKEKQEAAMEEKHQMILEQMRQEKARAERNKQKEIDFQ